MIGVSDDFVSGSDLDSVVRQNLRLSGTPQQLHRTPALTLYSFCNVGSEA